jgi:Ca-activated chloride channel homolog
MRLVAALAAFGVSIAAAGRQQAPTFRADTRTVALYVTVQDRDGRLIPDLTRADFEVRDNGRPAPITQFSSGLQPITMVLLLDMSSSMTHRHAQLRDAMLQFVETLVPGDRVRLGTFGEEILFTPFLTGDKEILRRLLHYELWPGGPTPLWNAMALGIGSIADEPGRRVVLTVTDGNDSCRGSACVPFRSVEAAALDGEVLVYAVGMEGSRLGGDIKRLARRTGGGHFDLAADADLAETFTGVAAELHQQYLIGFTPAVLDGKRHRIQVRMRTPGLTARTRTDYLASAD